MRRTFLPSDPAGIGHHPLCRSGRFLGFRGNCHAWRVFAPAMGLRYQTARRVVMAYDALRTSWESCSLHDDHVNSIGTECRLLRPPTSMGFACSMSSREPESQWFSSTDLSPTFALGNRPKRREPRIIDLSPTHKDILGQALGMMMGSSARQQTFG
jgi:hypothetical protein